jgi:hypothetical protein
MLKGEFKRNKNKKEIVSFSSSNDISKSMESINNNNKPTTPNSNSKKEIKSMIKLLKRTKNNIKNGKNQQKQSTIVEEINDNNDNQMIISTDLNNNNIETISQSNASLQSSENNNNNNINSTIKKPKLLNIKRLSQIKLKTNNNNNNNDAISLENLNKLYQLFPTISKDEKIVETFTCAYVKTMTAVLQGIMFLTPKYICFYGRQMLIIKISSILSIKKTRHAYILPTAIRIELKNSTNYLFTSFRSRSKTFDQISELIKVFDHQN